MFIFFFKLLLKKNNDFENYTLILTGIPISEEALVMLEAKYKTQMKVQKIHKNNWIQNVMQNQ